MKPLLLGLLLMPVAAFGQGGPADGTDIWAPVIANLPSRSLGPTNMGGRITDIAVYEKEPRIFYAGAASGGIWKTVNAGTTF